MNLLDKEWRIHVCHGEYRFLVKGMPTFVSREQADELEWLFFPFEPALRWGLSELTKILFDIHDYLTEGNVVRAFPKRRRFTPTLRAYVLHDLKRALATGTLVLERIEPIPIDAFSAPVFFDHREPGPPPAPKPEVPTTLFELQVVDGFGRPLEGLPVIFSVGGSPRTIDTDAEGMARLEGQQTSFASVRIEDVQAIQDKLDAFGEPPPGAEAPPASADVSVHMVSLSSFPSLSLEDKTQHTLVIRERVVRVRLIGMFFDEAKAFLLPSAMNGIQTLIDVYNEHPKAKLLVVGHTDREGKIEDNAELSLERAKSIAAYLRDDVDHWLSLYEESVAKKKRWGSQEDRYMLSSLPFGSSDPYLRPGQTLTKAVREFQREHGLKVDGIAGPQTRRALISDYMALDRTTVPEGTEIVTHGCGEHFPAIATEDGEEEAENRRVEIFVFPRSIKPEPSTELSEEGSTEHPQWVEQVDKTIDLRIEESERLILRLIADPLKSLLHNDQFILQNTSGSIRHTFSIPKHSVESSSFLELIFPPVPTDESYTLSTTFDDAIESLIFSEIPFPQLKNISNIASQNPPAPEDEDFEDDSPSDTEDEVLLDI